MKTLIEMLQLAATTKNGITYIKQGKEAFIAYAELERQAIMTLKQFLNNGVPNNAEMILQIDDDMDFLISFWACIYGGMKVALLPNAKTEQMQRTISYVLTLLDKPYICISSKENDKVTYSEKHNYAINRVVEITMKTDTTDARSEDRGAISQSCHPDDVAVIQFSSGSTGTPKGVSTTHANIIHNAHAIENHVKITNDDVVVSWLPLTHNFALLGIHMICIFLGRSQVIMPVTDFMVNPFSWIEAMNKHKATISASPNFGYKHFLSFYEKSNKDFCWDLSNVRAIINGAEPISYDLALQFIETLRPYGLSNDTMTPAYGMSEGTVAISIAKLGAPLNSKTIDRDNMNIGDMICETSDKTNATFVSVGTPVPEVQVRITDNRSSILSDGYIGNIEICGGNVMLGYYNDPVKTSEVFTKDKWLKTGDIGTIIDKELFITGRSKEIIFIAGKNYFPNDFDKLIEDNFPMLKNRIATTGVFNKKIETEQIVLFMDITHGPFEDTLITEIKRYFGRITKLQIEYVRFVSGLPRTQNGKIQRYKLQQSFSFDNFEEIPAPPAADSHCLAGNMVSDTIIKVCKEQLDSPTLSLSDNLFECGANSLKASIILARINDELHTNFTLNQLHKCETIGDFAALYNHEQPHSNEFDFNCSETMSIPASAQQRRMYTLFSVDPQNINYNITAAFEIDGQIDTGIIHDAFAKITTTHEALRTVFSFENNQIKQTILDAVDFAVEVIIAQPDDIAETIKGCVRPFDLTQAPLFKVCIIELPEQKSIMVIDMHHIITDGTSMGILVRDFINYLNGNPPLAPKHTYRDYVLWQNTIREQGGFEAQKKFWAQYLAGRSLTLELPIDVPERPKYINKVGNNIIFNIPADAVTKIIKASKGSAFNVLFAVYCVLLSKYANQNNVVIGVPTSARTKAQFLDIVGLFVNTTPYSVTIDTQETVAELISRVRAMSIEVLSNQDYQLDWIVDDLHIKRESNRAPLFDVMFTMENMEVPAMQMLDCQVRQIVLDEDVCKFDLNMIVTESKNGMLNGNLVYSTELYKHDSAKHMVKHFLNILDTMSENIDSPIGELAFFEEKISPVSELGVPNFDF